MGMIDRLNVAARQAAESTRESVQEAEIAHDLSNAYEGLGHVAFALSEQGEIADPRLACLAERVRELQSQLVELRARRAQSAGGPDARR
jgi:hypothetical protein